MKNYEDLTKEELIQLLLEKDIELRDLRIKYDKLILKYDNEHQRQLRDTYNTFVKKNEKLEPMDEAINEAEAKATKKAVALLQPYLERAKNASTKSNGRYLVATVKGDVHDIGKNIVTVVLGCNNFEVIDLGVMVPAEQIVQKAIESKVDFIALSGLITPSLDEMCNTARALTEAGITVPLLVGGATTSPLHTALKIAPLYKGPFYACKVIQQTRNPQIYSTNAPIRSINPIMR